MSQTAIATTNSLSIVTESRESRLQQAQEYICLLTGSTETECTFGCYDPKKQNPAKQYYGSISKLFDTLDRLNTNGYGIFVTVQETFSEKRDIKNIGKTRALFAEIDNQKGLPSQYHLKPNLIVESSPNNFHLYWILEKPIKLSKSEFESYIIPIIDYYQSDEVCKDLARVLRLPGFYHTKAKPFLVTIKQSSEARYDLEQIKIVSNPCNQTDTNVNTNPEKTETKINFEIPSNIEPIYKAKLHDECSKTFNLIRSLKRGKRHNTLNKKAYYLGGILSPFPELLAEYQQQLHELVSELEKQGKWDKVDDTHPTIDKAFESGKQKPILLEIEEKLSRSNQLKKILNSWLPEYGKLEWNEMCLQLELDREPIEVNYLRQRFQEDRNLDVSKELFTDIVVDIAKQHNYHPVREYLNSLKLCENPEAVFKKLYELMGISNNLEIQLIQVRKWLIAAVARVLNPGCKVDNVLILKCPKQGTRKSSFFEYLFSSKWFDTAGNHSKEADALLALKQNWCSEYGEIDHTFDKSSIEQLKAFLTKTSDTFRAPYAATSLKYKRDFIFCGTTNQQNFLPDKTGNRRYWVVDIHQKIDVKTIKVIRDEIWSAVKTLYLAGILGTKPDGEIEYVDNLWWFSEEEEVLAEENIKASEQYDSWEDDVMNYARNKKFFTLRDLKQDLQYPDNRATDMRVSAILKQHGMVTPKEAKTYNGTRARYWEYVETANTESLENTDNTEKQETDDLFEEISNNSDNREKLLEILEREKLEKVLKACRKFENSCDWIKFFTNENNNLKLKEIEQIIGKTDQEISDF